MTLSGWVRTAGAADQVWYDGGANNVWSLGDLNWDGGAAGWTDGNNAVFSGGGETVDVSGAVSVGNIVFQTNSYVIADADANGSLTLAGAPSVIEVQGAGNTGTVSEVIAGAGGFTKTGAGQLRLTAANTYAGTTTVSAGVLRLNPNTLAALGATGAGNNTVVEAGATLDFNGSYAGSGTLERFTIAGAGVDGQGVLVNTGTGHTNKNLEEVLLADDATIGGPGRIDILLLTGNGKTLTKIGGHQLCMRNLENAEIVINEGLYTLLDNVNGLGGNTPGNTTVNGGTLNAWNTLTVPERIVFKGGSLSQGNTPHTFYLAGYLTVSNNVTHTSAASRGVELSGFVDGPGGFTQAGDGWFIVTGNTNAYTGPTTVNSGKSLWVGRTNLFAGVLGFGTVTNAGYLYAYSPRLCQGNIVNSGTLFLNRGTLGDSAVYNSGTLFVLGGDTGTGAITNSGNLHFDQGGPYVVSNALFGTGTTRIRYKTEVTLDGSGSAPDYVRVADGVLTLTNGASLTLGSDLVLATRMEGAYTNAVMNFPVTAVVNVAEGTLVNARYIVIGNGATISNGLMSGTINQYGGVVRTYGATAESNGIRVAHYPLGLGTYRMRGGTLVIDNGWDLCIATDGTGWVHQTGGEIYTSRVMLNERNANFGFGRLTVAGGVLNIGLTNGILNVVTNGIMADTGAPYTVEFGGAGGVIRAVTNFWVPANATLYGTGTDAITFDTRQHAVLVSGNLTGPGGFNKTGSGTLTLSGNNTYAGPARILAGALVRGSAGALPAGSEVLFGVTAADDGGRLHSDGDLSLAGIVVGVANPGELDKAKTYTIATYGGSLTAGVEADNLPGPWYVYYDWAGKRVQIKAAVGTLISVH